MSNIYATVNITLDDGTTFFGNQYCMGLQFQRMLKNMNLLLNSYDCYLVTLAWKSFMNWGNLQSILA